MLEFLTYNIIEVMNMRLKELRKQKKITQEKLSKEIGFSRSLISLWESGISEPDNNTIIKLAEYFNCTTDYILGKTNAISTSEGIKIPVFGEVAAGIPISAIQDILDYEEITPEMASNGEYFGLAIKGDSMEPRMTTGDVVIVRSQPTAETGDIAIVMVDGESATCKKIKMTPEGIMLISLNPNYEPMFYSNKEIEELPVRILGKVVELRAKF